MGAIHWRFDWSDDGGDWSIVCDNCTTDFFFFIGLGVVTGAELNAALADAGGHALKGEHYTGPFVRDLEVDEPAPDEEVERDVQGVQI